MNLALNVKEWLAIYALLERNTVVDKHLIEIQNRMRNSLIETLNQVEKEKTSSQLRSWFVGTEAKIEKLNDGLQKIHTQASDLKKSVAPANVLTDDDESDNDRQYPRSVRKTTSKPPGKKR